MVLPTVGCLFLGCFVFFMGFSLLEATLPSLVSKSAPAGGRGTAMGIYSTSQFLGAFAGGVSGGFVAHHYGYEAVFLMAATMIGIWLMAAVTMKKPRHLKKPCCHAAAGDHIVTSDFVGKVPGVYDVVVIPEHRLALLQGRSRSLL
ncbi:MAG: MFS transporter [Porticoccaceae bacterium]